MTPQEQVVADATTTLQDACTAAGAQSPMDQLTAANATIADLRTQLATAATALTDAQTQLVTAQATKSNAAAFIAAFDNLRASI